MRVPFQLLSRGENLYGVLHIANNQKSTPVVVIMCYGLNGDRTEKHRMSVKFAECCENKKINVVRFDYANIGITEGDFFFSTFSQRVHNVCDIINFVKGCFNCKIKIILIGFSDGAKVAINVNDSVDDIEGIAFWNPIINLEQKKNEIKNLIQEEKFKIHSDYKKPFKPLLGVGLNIHILKELHEDKSKSKLDQISTKLFVFGEKDRFTENMRKFVNQEISSEKTVLNIKEAGHLFNNTEFEKQVIKNTVKWIEDVCYEN